MLRLTSSMQARLVPNSSTDLRIDRLAGSLMTEGTTPSAVWPQLAPMNEAKNAAVSARIACDRRDIARECNRALGADSLLASRA